MVISHEDMLGKIFLTKLVVNGEVHRACIVNAIEDYEAKMIKARKDN